jgi:hypothetical protein
MPITQEREGEIFRTTLEVLRDSGRRMGRAQLKDAVEGRASPTPDEQRIVRARDQMSAWGMRFGFNLSAGKRVGWVTNADDHGVWSLTPAGSRALDEFRGGELFRELMRRDPVRTTAVPARQDHHAMLERLRKGPRQ